jgi:cyclohexyl-isocyanide hydratase
MRIAFVVYDQMTALDFVGAYDALTRLKTMRFMPDLDWDVCARTSKVHDSVGLCFLLPRIEDSFERYDMVMVPGGPGSRMLMRDSDFVDWLRSAGSCRYKVSVCTGALLMGAAGFLKGKAATTHPDAMGELKEYCTKVVSQRIVDEGDVITAGGVTASIDLGLYLCEKLAGKDARSRIQKKMDYPQYT